MTHLRVPAWLLAAVLLLAPAHLTFAVVIEWVGPNNGDWNNTANWPGGIPPEASFNEAAAINNDTTALLSAPSNFEIGGLFLGQGAGQSGGLEIRSGGSLTNIPAPPETGAVVVGGAGTGTLTILGGGSLSAAAVSSGGGSGSSILLGDTTSSTAALTTTGNATLNRTTQVTGRFVDFSAGGNLLLGSAGTLVPRINHASLHSPLKAAGTATVSGTLRPEFVGITPTVGNTWNLVDAATINGNFTTVDTSAAPALPGGQAYQVVQTSGGTHGQLLQLTVAQLLTLEVNRETGAVTVRNTAPSGTNPISIDGYSLISSLGSLTGTWNSLQNQGVSGWLETGPHPTDLSELHPTGSLTLTGGQSQSLGTPYVAQFPAFGVDPDDLRFEYSTPAGRTIDGFIEYVGAKVHNNLIITVNPTTGQTQLKNDSPFPVSIDGYQISSASGSLRPANWSSLSDQGEPGWDEAAPTNFFLSELNPDGVLLLSPGQTFALGTPFDPAGTQDLEFRFLMAGEAAGDFSGSGSVGIADLNLVLDNWGAPVPPIPDGWIGEPPTPPSIGIAELNKVLDNWGATVSVGADDAVHGVVVYGAISGSGTVAAVPEPATACLLALGLALAALRRR